MKETNLITTKTYDVGLGFYADIVDNKAEKEPTWDVWLWHEGYAQKEHMFGLMQKSTPYEDAVDIMLGNLAEHIQFYYNDYILDGIIFANEAREAREKEEAEA